MTLENWSVTHSLSCRFTTIEIHLLHTILFFYLKNLSEIKLKENARKGKQKLVAFRSIR